MKTYQERLISDLKRLRDYYKTHQKKSNLTFDFSSFYNLDSIATPILGFSFEPTSTIIDEESAIVIAQDSYKEILVFNKQIYENFEELYSMFDNLDEFMSDIDYPTLPYYSLLRKFNEKDFTDILLSFLSEYGNDMVNIAKKYMDEDRIIMNYRMNPHDQFKAMHIGSKLLKSGYIILRHDEYTTYSLSSLVHELGHAYDRERFIYSQQKRIRNFEDLLIEVPSIYFEMEFYDYLIRNKINKDGAMILKNEKLTRMSDTFASFYITTKEYFKIVDPIILQSESDYNKRSAFRNDLIYGLGIYISIHLSHLRRNMNSEEFMKELYNFISSRKERTLKESVEGLGIDYNDFLTGTYVYPEVHESSLKLKRRFKIYE